MSTTTLATGMQSFVIEGGRPLSGTVRAAGNKNGALPILAACLLTTSRSRSANVPRIRDVETMVELLADLGADVEWTGPNEVRVDAADVHKTRARRGALPPDPRVVPARRPAARAPRPRERAAPGRRRDRPPPPRPAHPRVRGARRRDRDRRPLRDGAPTACAASAIFLDEASVMATENAVMAAVLARGRDGDRQRRLRAARAGPLPLPRLARRADRGDRVERAADRRRRALARRRAGASARTTSRSAASSASPPSPAAT